MRTRIAALLVIGVSGIANATSFSGGNSDDGQALGLDGKGDKIVVPNCEENANWLQCRNIDDAPADVIDGFNYTHDTTNTIGPNDLALSMPPCSAIPSAL